MQRKIIRSIIPVLENSNYQGKCAFSRLSLWGSKKWSNQEQLTQDIFESVSFPLLNKFPWIFYILYCLLLSDAILLTRNQSFPKNNSGMRLILVNSLLKLYIVGIFVFIFLSRWSISRTPCIAHTTAERSRGTSFHIISGQYSCSLWQSYEV